MKCVILCLAFTVLAASAFSPRDSDRVKREDDSDEDDMPTPPSPPDSDEDNRPRPPHHHGPGGHGPGGHGPGGHHHGPGGHDHHLKPCCGNGKLPLMLSRHGDGIFPACMKETDEKTGFNKDEVPAAALDFSTAFSCDKIKQFKKKQSCMHECTMKKLELADSNGALDFPKIKEKMIARANETWQKDLITKAVDACSEHKYDATWNEEDSDIKCNSQAHEFKYCLYREVETMCPEEYQNTGKKCTSIRQALAASRKNTV